MPLYWKRPDAAPPPALGWRDDSRLRESVVPLDRAAAVVEGNSW